MTLKFSQSLGVIIVVIEIYQNFSVALTSNSKHVNLHLISEWINACA